MKSRNLSQAIAIFVKTPGFSPIKTRLAQTVGKQCAEEFYALSIQAIREVVREATLQATNLSAFWAIAESDSSADAHWAEFEIIHQKGDSLGERLHGVYAELQSKFDSITFIGGDAPQISSELILNGIEFPDDTRPQVNVGPSTDGGFYLFSSNSPMSEKFWRAPTYSSATTLAQLLDGLSDMFEVRALPSLTDVDEGKDLPTLLGELQNLKVLSPGQRQIVDWIKRSCP